MIHSLLAVVLVAEIGVGMMAVAVTEGIADSGASFANAWLGALSDWPGQRTMLAGAGCGLAARTNPIFPLPRRP